MVTGIAHNCRLAHGQLMSSKPQCPFGRRSAMREGMSGRKMQSQEARNKANRWRSFDIRLPVAGQHLVGIF